MQRNTAEARPYFFELGIILVISYLGFYFINLILSNGKLGENIMLRLLVGLLGFTLLLRSSWPAYMKKIEYWIFYFTLFFSFSFFFFFMLLNNQNSNIWQINCLVGLVLLALFIDWIGYIILVSVGIILAYFFTYFTVPDFYLQKDLLAVFASYSPPVIYFIIISRKNDILDQERQLHYSKIDNLNSELEQKIIQAKSAIQAKTEFLNNMSHEIRTPIFGFTTMSEILFSSWSKFDDQKKLSLVQQIYLSSKRLYSLIGNLLDLSKFSAGKMLLNPKESDINLLIDNMIDECQTLYLTDKKIFFNFTKRIKTKIIVDDERIMQVLRNILTNSIKYSENNSIIAIEVSRTKITYDDNTKRPAIHIKIKDQGIGIPENELETIFEPFTQSSKTKTRAGGTGLGLAICKEIIEAHHGKIWAQNNDNEPGATFNFILPLNFENRMEGHLVVSRTSDSIKKNKNATILIIDDDELCLSTMELMLNHTNYKLIKAQGGVDGLKRLETMGKNIDIILLDLMMPDMYGLDVLHKIKLQNSLKMIPVVLQTGTSDMGEIEKAYKLGISGYIKKPYQKTTLLNLINSLIR